MLMWYVILGIVIISAGAGLIYLSGRVARFGFMKMFDRNGNNAQCRKTAGFVLILLIFAALSLTINLVNAVVCLLHFVCIWLLCDLVFLFGRTFSEAAVQILLCRHCRYSVKLCCSWFRLVFEPPCLDNVLYGCIRKGWTKIAYCSVCGFPYRNDVWR